MKAANALIEQRCWTSFASGLRQNRSGAASESSAQLADGSMTSGLALRPIDRAGPARQAIATAHAASTPPRGMAVPRAGLRRAHATRATRRCFGPAGASMRSPGDLAAPPPRRCASRSALRSAQPLGGRDAHAGPGSVVQVLRQQRLRSSFQGSSDSRRAGVASTRSRSVPSGRMWNSASNSALQYFLHEIGRAGIAHEGRAGVRGG